MTYYSLGVYQVHVFRTSDQKDEREKIGRALELHSKLWLTDIWASATSYALGLKKGLIRLMQLKETVVESNDLYYTSTIFLVFMCYGFSNLYIAVFLRKKEGRIIGLLDFIGIFMGNIRNYLDLNRRFRKALGSSGEHVFLNRCVGLVHLVSPVLILILICSWVVSIGFYS